VEDMKEKGVLEPLRVKKHAIESATEVAVMILRIDDVIAAKELEKEKEKEKESSGGGEEFSSSEF
ncbi:MAG TPA: thermosome subunit, partial [Archaeoglobus profundus]|nr:thermosome subunit [Archaeoglobus profundus]